MIVLLLSSIFTMSLVKSEIMTFDSKPLVDQMEKSLSQVNDLLANIEGKIEADRRRQIDMDYDMLYPDAETDFMDYQVTNIWRSTKKSSPPPETTPTSTLSQTISIPEMAFRYQPTVQLTPSMASVPVLRAISSTSSTKDWDRARDRAREIAMQKIMAYWASTVRTVPVILRYGNFTSTSSMIPTTKSSNTVVTTTTTTELVTEPFTETGIPQNRYLNWPFKNTPHPGNTKFVLDLVKELHKSKHGYFTVGMAKFLEMIATRDPSNTTPVLRAIQDVSTKLMKEHKWREFYEVFQNMAILMQTVNAYPIKELKSMAVKGQRMLKNNQSLANPQLKTCFDKLDHMFQQKEGVALFGSLEEFYKYPNGGQKASEVSKDMLEAAIAPFVKPPNTEEHVLLLACVNESIHAFYNSSSANSTKKIATKNVQSSVKLNETGALSTGPPSSDKGAPNKIWRRHNENKYNERERQFLTKHRRMPLNRPHKYNKPNQHHHDDLHHNDHLHTHYDESERQHPHEQHDEQDLHNRYDSHEPHDNHDERYSLDQNDKHEPEDSYEQYDNVQRNQKKKLFKRTDKQSLVTRVEEDKDSTSDSRAYFRGIGKKHKSVQITKIVPNPAETTPTPNIFETIGKHFLLGLAKKLEAKVKNENNRRFMSSSETESNQESERKVKNKFIHKIRETSSYSDEEMNLKTNLYDARRGS